MAVGKSIFFKLLVVSMALAGSTSFGRTLFLAHFDGDTGSSGMEADYAARNPEPVKAYGNISSDSVFGDGAYYNMGVDLSDPNNDVLAYYREGNLNTHSGTLEMWIKPSSWDNGEYQGLFSLRVDNGHEIRIQKRDSCQISIYVSSDSGTWGLYKNAFFLNDNQWYHLAWTWDIENQISELYLDGNVVDTVKFGTIADYIGVIASMFILGDFDPKGGPYRFLGKIDEVRISSIDLYKGLPFIPSSTPYQVEGCAEYPVGDLNEDCIVDILDFTILARNWMYGTAQ